MSSVIARSKKNYDEISTELIEDNTTSFWLKDAIKSIRKRDALDMMSDIELLVDLHKKYREKFNLPF